MAITSLAPSLINTNAANRASNHTSANANAAAPSDAFVRSATPEVSIASYGAQIMNPIEITADATKLPNAADRIDSIKEVLTVQEVWDMGYTGKGVTVAILDTGARPHPDTDGRTKAFADFCHDLPQSYDGNGHGSHCQGLVGGNGKMAGGRFKGPAYEANFVIGKVLDDNGGGNMSNVVKGLEWVLEHKDEYNTRVISMSLGAPSNLKENDDIIAKAVKKCHDAGILVCIAAGNSGPGIHTIGTPGISSNALTVGAYDDKNTASHDDDTMAYFSSRGETTRDHHIKPDIAAPGVNMVSLRSPGSELDKADLGHIGRHYVLMSGTSMATPVTAGCAALLFQANPDLTPDQAKEILMSTAEPLADTPAIVGGAGLIDPAKAVRAALKLKEEHHQG